MTDKEVGELWREATTGMPHQWECGHDEEIVTLIRKLVEMALGASFGYTPPSHPQYKARLMVVLERFGIDPATYP